MKKRIFLQLAVIVSLTMVIALYASSCKKKDKDPVPGCMTTTAMNYNPDATEDDGSCLKAEQKQRTTVVNFTATWCGPCGSWGIPALINAYTTKPNDVVPLKVQCSGSQLLCPFGDAFANAYNVTGIPHFVVGNQNNVGSSSMISTITSQIAGAPVANAVAQWSVSGTTITIKTQTEFFTAGTGDYYLSVYLMENGAIATQSGATSNIHNKIIRGNASSSTYYGELISSGAAAAGKIIDKTYTATVGSGWNAANMYTALVIWKKNGSKYDFVNAWQSKAN